MILQLNLFSKHRSKAEFKCLNDSEVKESTETYLLELTPYSSQLKAL